MEAKGYLYVASKVKRTLKASLFSLEILRKSSCLFNLIWEKVCIEDSFGTGYSIKTHLWANVHILSLSLAFCE